MLSMIQFTNTLVKTQKSLDAKSDYRDMGNRMRVAVENRAALTNFKDTCSLSGILGAEVVSIPNPYPLSDDPPTLKLRDVATGKFLNQITLSKLNPSLPSSVEQLLIREFAYDALGNPLENEFQVGGGPISDDKDLGNRAHKVEVRAIPDSDPLSYNLEIYVKKFKPHGKDRQPAGEPSPIPGTAFGTGLQYMEDRFPLKLKITTTDPALGGPVTVQNCENVVQPQGPQGFYCDPATDPGCGPGTPPQWADYSMEYGFIDAGSSPGVAQQTFAVPLTKKYKAPPKVITFFSAVNYVNTAGGYTDFHFGTHAEAITLSGFNLRWDTPDNCASAAGCIRTFGRLGWIAVGEPDTGEIADNMYVQFGETIVPNQATYSSPVISLAEEYETPPTVFLNFGNLGMWINCTGHNFNSSAAVSSVSTTGFSFNTSTKNSTGSCGWMELTKVQWVAIGVPKNPAKKSQKIRVGSASTMIQGGFGSSVFFDQIGPANVKGQVFAGLWCTDSDPDFRSIETLSVGASGIGFYMSGVGGNECILDNRPRSLNWIATTE